LQWTGAADFLSSPGPAVVCGIISLIIIVLLGRLLTAKSMKGARTLVQILGFQEFMNRVDADRLKRMPPDTFEKFLPYAMALGVEHRWAKAFEGIIQNPPTWYSGDWSTFNTFYFVNSLGSLSQTASSTFVSAPRSSSSSSGFGGGDSGGGGFSGGGGSSGSKFQILASTNIALPIVEWTPVVTNTFDASGNFQLEIAPPKSTSREFYLLKLP